jgi:hypothetical protein
MEIFASITPSHMCGSFFSQSAHSPQAMLEETTTRYATKKGFGLSVGTQGVTVTADSHLPASRS